MSRKSIDFIKSIKSINPIQKYLHITETYACSLKNVGYYAQPQSYQNVLQFCYLHIMLSNKF